VSDSLASGDLVVSSTLTLIECDRVLIRAVVTGQLKEAEAASRRGTLARAAAHWTLLDLVPEIADRARRPFPREPLRTLDAIHLATLIVARDLVPETRILSLDRPIRECARDLGFEVLPA
jgi:predicted nucleic acid-binding protein